MIQPNRVVHYNNPSEKAKDDERKLKRELFEAMLKSQMSTVHGRKFVMWILGLLKWNEKNLFNSAEAYRIAAQQAAAIDIYNTMYAISPEEFELMMREAKKE
ncbi:MAG: hypothetical protein H6Q72_4127 [Firmicutes bacterium]|nr:hypothetical protein [Bacillota bacterium]